MMKMTESHNHHIEKRDGEYRRGLKDQDLFFEKKYADQLTRHNHDFKTLEEKNRKVIDDLKMNLTSEISNVSKKNDDPFYKFETLKPKMKTFEDRIEIEVAVPEHAKSDVQLTTNGKEAVLTFNRRYADATRTPEGTIHKINKVESFTTRLQTDHVLNPKSMKSNYADGVMTYVIKRA
jgi:HSP20 family molecular chaperone IbpA